MRLARTLHIFEADRRLILTLGLLHFLVAAAHSFFDIGVTALLIAHLGPDTLPQVYLGSALSLIFVGLVIIPLIDRLDRTRLFSGILAVFAVVLFISTPLAADGPELAYRGLYILCYLMKSLVFLQFWLLAGDLLDIRQAKRLFPVLLGFSLMGGLAASITATFLPRFASTEILLTSAGVLLVAGLIPVQILAHDFRGRLPAHRETPPRLTETWHRLGQDFRVALSSRLLRTVSLCLLLLALLAQVLDFLMGKAAHTTFASVHDLTSFYAILNTAVIGLGALVQLGLANRIISSLGVTKGQLLAPVAFLGAFLATGAVWLASGGRMGQGFFIAVLASRAVQKVLRISIVRTSTDLVFNAVPSDQRGRAKAFKETVTEPFGVLLGGAFLMLGAILPLQYLLGGALLLSVLFLFLTVELKEDYLESLVSVLKEKSRFRFALPSMVMRARKPEPTPANVSTLKHALDNEEASVRLLAVEIASELKEPEAAALLVDRYRQEQDSEVRALMVSALGKMVHTHHDVSQNESLEDLDPRVRASGMASMAESGIFRADELAGEVRTESDPATPGDGAVGDGRGAPSPTEALSKPVRRAQFLDLARSGERDALERLIHYLEQGDGATRHLAARALESCGEPAVDILTLALWSTDVEGRRYVIRALGRIGSAKARQSLLPVLSLEAEEAYYDLVRLEALHHLPDEPAVELMKDAIVQRVERARRNAHRVLRAVFIREPGMRLILSNLNHPDRYVRSSAIEALEVRVDPAILGGVLPLFEHENPGVIAEHGSALFEFPRREPHEVVLELTKHRSAWIRACAVYVLGHLGTAANIGVLEERLTDRDELVRLNAIEAIGRLKSEASLPLVRKLLAEGDRKTRDYARAAIATIEKESRTSNQSV